MKMQSPAVSEPRRTRWNSESLSGLVILTLSLCAYLMTYQFPTVPPMLSQNIPPTFFPRVILTATAFLSTLLLLRGFARPEPAMSGIPRIIWITAGLIGGSVILMNKIGMLPMLFLTSLFLPLLWGERRWVRLVFFAVMVPTAIYLLFTTILGLRLPMGILERIP